MIKIVLKMLTLICIVFSMGGMYAFVYDCEPISPEKQYEMDRSVWSVNRDPSDWAKDFPSFNEWLGEREASESRMTEWVINIGREFGYQVAETFDPSYERPYQDPRESYAAEAPDHPTWSERE